MSRKYFVVNYANYTVMYEIIFILDVKTVKIV
jgi:hypothetical protein